MKRAVSISLGSLTRDKTVELTLLGERVCLERIGTNALEAALVAATGKGRALTSKELEDLVRELNIQSEVRELRK